LIADYFVQIRLFAKEAGISDFKEINIDGTKIKTSYPDESAILSP